MLVRIAQSGSDSKRLKDVCCSIGGSIERMSSSFLGGDIAYRMKSLHRRDKIRRRTQLRGLCLVNRTLSRTFPKIASRIALTDGLLFVKVTPRSGRGLAASVCSDRARPRTIRSCGRAAGREVFLFGLQ